MSYEESSKDRLEKIINQKIRTTMIGALDAFEHMFEELINENPRFKQSFQEVRKEILDNGNNQIRAIKKELDQYTVSWNRYTINFTVKGRDE